MASVVDRDRGYRAMMTRIRKAGIEQSVSVGLHTDAGESLRIGAIHEFGAGSVPRRSFIADWADENAAKNAAMMKRAAESVIKGASAEVALNRLGAVFVGDIQGRIAGGIDPPLAPATIARKGSSTPLIDTGQLRSSISHKVNS